MKVRIAMFVIVFAIVIGGGGLYYNLTASRGYGTDPQHSAEGTRLIGGHLAPVPTFEELVRHSDAVILGRITASESKLVQCCDSMATRLPPEKPAPVRRVDTTTISVVETLKGALPAEIKVKTEKPGGNVIRSGDENMALVDFEIGKEYLLFVVDRSGHYEVQGFEKGLWTVAGDSVSQTATGVSYGRTEFDQKVSEHLD